MSSITMGTDTAYTQLRTEYDFKIYNIVVDMRASRIEEYPLY